MVSLSLVRGRPCRYSLPGALTDSPVPADLIISKRNFLSLYALVNCYADQAVFDCWEILDKIHIWSRALDFRNFVLNCFFIIEKKIPSKIFGNSNRGRRTKNNFNKVPVAILVRVRWSLLVHDTASTLMNCLMQCLLAGMNWLWLLLLLLLSHISTISWKIAISQDLAWNSRHQMIFYVKLLTQLSIIKFVMTNKVWVINYGLLSFQFDGWELGYLSRSQSKFE